ncbi:PREDICTED: proteoglycan 4-like isoform X1 [Ceratosolen solmsi marchali]|uniref:Proteoglycan 4-like isoform X1 n=1 Tax=Ceratosolen solmsi marchali TaxID=326594 RepID=A0AAJ6YLP9_9HYME|nr:PREDICTED: proteoglycan 4-like isoform X1 [Ceratosolen solmsi marchali]XP_011500335.1 PREDICTED: proteoglycan 4-like isoform X1 [Ceratosolen solmsi marchali]
MGARQSRRSVDITTTPKKEGLPTEGVIGEGPENIEKLGMIEEADAKPTSNGVAPHTDTSDDKDKDKDEATEKDQDKEKQPEEVAAKEEVKTAELSAGEAIAEVTAEAAPAEVTTPTTETPVTPASPNSTATTPDTKEAKKKDKSKKKWSFRSISFSRKDKSKPVREATPKNGDVAKEEPLTEGGEEAEAAAATTGEASSPDDKSVVSSPSEESKDEAKEKSPSEEAPSSPVAADPPAEEQPATKKEQLPPASGPAPVEVVPVPATATATAAVTTAAAPVTPAAPAALPESKDESTPESEPAPVLENNLAAKNEILPMENGVADEAPKSPPPAVPVEAPQTAPAITEDVASVTKAIEEIDISEKAVAAAVNENIESAGKNEIVADSIHQNNLNE